MKAFESNVTYVTMHICFDQNSVGFFILTNGMVWQLITSWHCVGSLGSWWINVSICPIINSPAMHSDLYEHRLSAHHSVFTISCFSAWCWARQLLMWISENLHLCWVYGSSEAEPWFCLCVYLPLVAFGFWVLQAFYCSQYCNKYMPPGDKFTHMHQHTYFCTHPHTHSLYHTPIHK